MPVPILHVPSVQKRAQPSACVRFWRRSSLERRRCCQRGLVILLILVILGFFTGLIDHTAFASDVIIVPRISTLSYELAIERSPFMVNASLFAMQGATSVAVLTIIYCTDHTHLLSRRLRRSLYAYFVISVLSGCMYLRLFSNQRLWMVEFAGENWIIDRNAHWAISTPIQWFIFCESCTRARRADYIYLGVTSFLTQFLGMLFICVRPLSICVIFFMTSCFTFALMFRRVYTVTLLPDIAHITQHIRLFTMVLWTIYPCVTLLRYIGFLSAWKEQVLFYSILDIITKSLTFGSIVIARFAFNMASMQGSVQLLLAANDLILTVDSSFHVLDRFRALPLVAFHFGDDLEKHSLLELCVDGDDRQRLRDAAWAADNQPLDALTPKCRVAFRLPIDGKVFFAELHVSRHSRGQRIIGVIIQLMKADRQLSEVDCIADETESIGCSSIERASAVRGLDLQEPADVEQGAPSEASSLRLVLSLQNCMSVLELDFEIREMLCGAFICQAAPVGLFFWDGQSFTGEGGPAMVATSPMLETVFGSLQTPVSLGSVIGEDAVVQILVAIRIFDLVLFQLHARLPDSRNCRVTVLPLGRLSRAATSFEINLCLVLIEPELPSPRADSGISSSKFFWYSAGGHHPVCIRCESPFTYIAPPMVAELSYPVHGTCKWLLFYENDVGPLGILRPHLHVEERSSARLVFALPADVPIQAALSRHIGASAITTDVENTLVTALNMGALDCMKTVPVVLSRLVDASNRRSPRFIANS